LRFDSSPVSLSLSRSFAFNSFYCKFLKYVKIGVFIVVVVGGGVLMENKFEER
jgi:hypothetical protein